MKRTAVCILLFMTLSATKAADSLQVIMNKTVFVKGDSIDFSCFIPDYAALKLNTATLNVWIEDIGRNKRWKFRYPMLNGEVSATLSIGNKIPDGQYAVNFLVQRGFFRISGKVIDAEKKDSLINYMMAIKNKKGSYFDNARVSADGNFRLKSTLFEDSAFFIFSPVKKVKENDLKIRIETSLDSFFVPAVSATKFITIGKQRTNLADQKLSDTNRYVFNADELTDKALLLPGVTVNARIKKNVEQFNEKYSQGLFQREDAIIFDGIDDDMISRSFSVLQFLQAKVPGLTIDKDSAGQEYARWRNETAEIYVDEFRMDIGDHLFVRPSEVAMIKVYRPPANISSFSGGAGAIAIYTKRGQYGASSKSMFRFVVKGYTAMDSVWE